MNMEASYLMTSVKDPSVQKLQILDENGGEYYAKRGAFGHLFASPDETQFWDPIGREVELAPEIKKIEAFIAPVKTSEETCDLFFVERTDGEKSIARTVYYDDDGNSSLALDLAEEAIGEFSRVTLELIADDLKIEPVDFSGTIIEMWLEKFNQTLYEGSDLDDWLLVSSRGRFHGCRKWQFYNINYQTNLLFQTFHFRKDIFRPAISRDFNDSFESENPPLFIESSERGKSMSIRLLGGVYMDTDEHLFGLVDRMGSVPFYYQD